MRLYLAGAETTGMKCVKALEGLQDLAFLSSYWYLKKNPAIISHCVENKIPHMLDSGAFSALHSGAEIDIAAYCDFIKEHGAKFEKIAQLDCIGDWKGTAKNLDYMRAQGLNPIPVFHTNEPFDWLDELLKNDYLCLGVTGSKLRQSQIIAWLVKVFKRREHINPDCKMHGFALTAAKVIKYFDWDTCDSSTWLAGQKFSRIITGDNLKQVHRKDWKKINENIPSDVFITPTGTTDRLPPIWRWNAEKMLEYVRKVNKVRRLSQKPTV